MVRVEVSGSTAPRGDLALARNSSGVHTASMQQDKAMVCKSSPLLISCPNNSLVKVPAFTGRPHVTYDLLASLFVHE